MKLLNFELFMLILDSLGKVIVPNLALIRPDLVGIFMELMISSMLHLEKKIFASLVLLYSSQVKHCH